GGGDTVADPEAPVFFIGKVGGEDAALGAAELVGERVHVSAGLGVLGGWRRLGKKARGDFHAGGTLKVGELEVERLRARRIEREQVIRIVEMRGGAGLEGGGIFFRLGGERGEGRLVGAERFRGSTDAKNLHAELVALN